MAGRRTPRVAALVCPALCLAVLAAGCSDAEPTTGPADDASPSASDSTSASPSDTPTPSAAAPDLPPALTLEQVSGRTIRAEPFADFAVATDQGVWVTGVAPGAVLYDDRSGEVAARVRVEGSVQQAVEESAGSVWLPTADPSLLRVDARTGEVLWTARLPATPFPEGVVGAVGNTGYVLADQAQPTIFVVSGGKVVERIEAPDLALGVRAGHGALWVPTDEDTIERYDLATREWTSIPTGPGPRFLDIGYGAVWVMNQADGSVTRIDARTRETELLPASPYYIRGGDLTTGAGAVWLRTDDSVLRIDPRTREVTHVLELPPGSGSVAATPDVLWITNHDHLAVHAVPLPLPD